jgi:hypothetical protein
MYQQQGMPASDSASPAVKTEAQPSAAPATTDTVSLSAPGEQQAAGAAKQATAAIAHPPEVFAEIWKDGMKIASVYTDGQAVTSAASVGMAGIGQGSPMPYLRAQELSRMMGGEVKFVDLHALQVAQTRSQLRAAYGA